MLKHRWSILVKTGFIVCARCGLDLEIHKPNRLGLVRFADRLKPLVDPVLVGFDQLGSVNLLNLASAGFELGNLLVGR